MKKINVKKSFLLFFLTLMIAVLAACGGNTEKNYSSDGKDGEVTSGGSLNVGLSANAKTFDPIKYTGVYESQVMRQMGDTLVVYNKDLSDIIPSLATEWKVSDDMLVYTFKLREGVKFQKGQYQDGREMTAEDVKYSLERSAKESAMNRLSGVTEVKVLSDYEVEIHLATPNAALLAMLTDAGNIIIPKEEIEGWGDKFSEHFVGTGPFQLTEWKKDQEVKLARHENYWGDKPHLDHLTMKFISDQNMMTNALRSGDIDIAMDVKGQNREIINQDSNLDLLTNPGLSIVYLDLNNKVGPTADKRVREAIYMATNVEEIISGVNQWGGGDVSYLPLPPGSWGYDKSLIDMVPKYNPEEAKKDEEPEQEEKVDVIFTHSEIPYEVRLRMRGKSMPMEDSLIKFGDLSYLKLTFYGFDNKIHNGEMVVNKEIAPEVVDIFKELYEKKYPIEKMKLIDDYDGDDEASMQDNNTSAFCYRGIAGSDTLSNHAKGLAIDINPKQNPHVTAAAVMPKGSEMYANRDDIKKGMIRKYDLCYKAFTDRGWSWGGHWKNPDYQHFEKLL